jgi:small subunit ribosomal protein S12
MVTWTQLAKKTRVTKRRDLKAPAFNKAPHRKGIVYRVTTMPPRKPNSAKRTFAKVRLNLVVKKFLLKFQEWVSINCKLIV